MESGYRPDTISSAGAAGLWQFMPQTARAYGLRVDEWTDDRLDPYKSTLAAARYLKKLRNQFRGNWEYALTSYNAGETRVRKALQVQHRHQMPEGYWKLELKAESRDYYPKFMALVAIYQNRSAFDLTNVQPERTTGIEVLNIPTTISLADVARRSRIPFGKLWKLNPFLIKGEPPPDQEKYRVYLPKHHKEVFIQSFE